MGKTTKTRMKAAAAAKIEGELQVALADLDIYLNNPVGIGEHANVMDEVVYKLKVITEALDVLETLNRLETIYAAH